MNCKHCKQPIQRCTTRFRSGHLGCGFYGCRGHVHAYDQLHACEDGQHSAEPEPGTLPASGAPASAPEGEVA